MVIIEENLENKIKKKFVDSSKVIVEMLKDIEKGIVIGVTVPIKGTCNIGYHVSKALYNNKWNILKGVALEHYYTWHLPTASRKGFPEMNFREDESKDDYIKGSMIVSGIIDGMLSFLSLSKFLSMAFLIEQSSNLSKPVQVVDDILTGSLIYLGARVGTNAVSLSYEGLRKWYLHKKNKLENVGD